MKMSDIVKAFAVAAKQYGVPADLWPTVKWQKFFPAKDTGIPSYLQVGANVYVNTLTPKDAKAEDLEARVRPVITNEGDTVLVLSYLASVVTHRDPQNKVYIAFSRPEVFAKKTEGSAQRKALASAADGLMDAVLKVAAQ